MNMQIFHSGQGLAINEKMMSPATFFVVSSSKE
jgi:hypothetical protein